MSPLSVQNPNLMFQQQASFSLVQDKQHQLLQTQQVMIEPQQNMPYGQVPSSPNTNSPTSRGRGRGSRPRGRGRGTGGGRGGKIKQETDVQLMSPSQPFGMLPMGTNSSASVFNFNNPMSTAMSIQTDVKPVLNSEGQIISPMIQNTMEAAGISAVTPTKPICSPSRGSPSSRGRGGGRGRGRGQNPGTLKDEKPSLDLMSTDAVVSLFCI